MAQIYDREENLSFSDSCLCFITPNTTVLEFGSATGYATRYMTENFNCKVTCIEISPIMAEKGKKYANKMIIADIDADSWETKLDDTFDYIIFADVLEHLKNPMQVIARVEPFLKQDGAILTSIPNIGHNAIIMNLRNGKFTYTETGLLDNTHIHFFTRESIVELFKNYGLYCFAEEHKIIRPCDTEFKNYYTSNPLLALSLINKKDGHVYRFVHKWTRDSKRNHQNYTANLSLLNKIYELTYDFICYFKRKLNIVTPNIVTKLIFKPLEKRNERKYDKYKS